MSSLSSSQRSFPFSFGDEATLNETQGSLATQAKAHSFVWKTSQEKSKRDPWRCWNVWATKFAYDTPCCKRDRFKPRSPCIKRWCWSVTHETQSRTTLKRKLNISVYSRKMVSTPNILFDWIYVLNNCFLRQTQNAERIRRSEWINTSINQSANYYYIKAVL